MTVEEEHKKPTRSRFQRHTSILIWKCYVQRQRRWRLLVIETLFAGALFLVAIYTAKPVFLTPLQDEPEPPLASNDLIDSLHSGNILGYAPNTSPYDVIMKKVSDVLQVEIMAGPSEDELNNMLYNKSRGTPISNPVIWVIFKPTINNMWKFSIRSTERAKYATSADPKPVHPNPHLRAGFLGVQLAVSEAILEYSSKSVPQYELTMVSMPVSPLMQESKVRQAIAGILLCFTLALLPPVLETEALVVKETQSRFKRALRIRNVDYSSMYLSWLVYAYLTSMPICLLASISLILIFRWIHLVFTLVIMLAYVSVMIMLAMIMAMFHNKAWIACVWSTLFTFLQTFLAELLVYHEYDVMHAALTFLLHIILPPMGLVHGFNQFALLQTGRGSKMDAGQSPLYTLALWCVMIALYFGLLMILQRTISQERAIGGQVSWKSVIFKKAEDTNRLQQIPTPTGRERDNLQEVDDLVAKAVSFRSVTKNIMGVPVLSNVTFDVYRGEYSLIFAKRIEQKMMNTIEDLLTGLTFADSGTINVLGQNSMPGKNFMSESHMMGYCHRCKFLVDDLTVQEHLTLFTELCLWRESMQFVVEYGQMRSKKLLEECDLEGVKNDYVRNLDLFYRAQLCWAIAMLMEPRVIIMPSFTDKPAYKAVIKDKVMQYKRYVTIIKLCFSSVQLEYADRVFLFESRILVFGGTPAYMFFKFGREYRVRMTFRTSGSLDDDNVEELIKKAQEAGATVRAHFGSLLILRLPASPTAVVAAFVKDLTENANKYGMTSLNISLPDPEEVCKRAINESKVATTHEISNTQPICKEALLRISEPPPWKRKTTWFNTTQMKSFAWKYYTFYKYHRILFVVTIVSALVTGIVIGLSLSSLLAQLDRERGAKKMLHGEVLTVEALEQRTTLVLRSDGSSISTSICNAYVLSETEATEEEINDIFYTALSSTESLTEYLVTRAIDSPQQYVYMYAYGMDVATDENDTLTIQALYSPLHFDQAAAARSLGRIFMALMRHYTGNLDATITVTDDPLALDLTPWMKQAAAPPLLIQFLLILTICHITLLPSKEYGLIRHMQCHAMNFSPARYWFTMFFCDLLLYWMLVGLMTIVMVAIVYLVVPIAHFQFSDIVIVPVMLALYGISCVPQAYLFSLGPRPALNSMTYVIVSVVFGETTVVATILYQEALHYTLQIMSISPQYNMAYAFVKIKQIFIYNSECIIFTTRNICSSKTLHRCCQKCGVLQTCFSRKSYFSGESGVQMEAVALISTGILFMSLLLLWEYKIIQQIWNYFSSWWIHPEKLEADNETAGVRKEKAEVLEKKADLKSKRRETINTYGEYLLACDVSKKEAGYYSIRNVYLGLGKGEALSLSGLKRDGRLKLCELLAGYKLHSRGQLWAMSKWRLCFRPHMYARQISLSCERDPLPLWMTVRDALRLIAALRGVPNKYVDNELKNYIEALELEDIADTLVGNILQTDKIRLHFAAAIIGAPPIIVLDEFCAYQKFTVRRSMYYILYHLRKRGHAIFVSSSGVESHMPVTNRLAIMIDGRIYDIDHVDNLVERYSHKGYTVVVHLKDEVDVKRMFAKHFKKFVINDTSEVLVNIQILDEIDWDAIFQRMETLKTENQQVYSYIISSIPIDHIYNYLLNTQTKGLKPVEDFICCSYVRKFIKRRPVRSPNQKAWDDLVKFEHKYDITTLKELPWSVIFHR